MTSQTVLLVDPDRDSQAIYTMILEHHGYRVQFAPTASEGLALARREHPDVVVAELFQPPVEGDPLPVRMRREPELATIPVIGISSLAPHARAPGQEACDAHLSKPCTPSRLVAEVRRRISPLPVLAR